MTRIVQLSDTHILEPGALLYREVDTARALTQAVERINTLRPVPDLVVISGDLVNAGLATEYAHLRELLEKLTVPWALLPGNHDERSALRAAFPEQGWDHEALAVQRLQLDAGEVLLLDTLVPGQVSGEFGEAHLDWLKQTHDGTQDALLFLHHPPVATGIVGMDQIGLVGAGRLAEWLHSPAGARVRGLFCGHIHRSVFTCFAGRPLAIAPAPAHQIALDLSDDPAALAWTTEPGGMLVIDWRAGLPPVVHVLPVAMAPVKHYVDMWRGA